MKLPSMRNPFSVALCGLTATPALAADLSVTLQVPPIDTAEYHRPYVAVWLEREDRSVASQLALWYQQKRGGPAAAAPPMGPAAEGGTKWLPDLRQWWRRGGREMSLPADGVTGATRAVGEYELSFSQGKAPLGDLTPGAYKLVVEAAREDGGREVLDIPFQWPVKTTTPLKAQGKSELGAVTLLLKP